MITVAVELGRQRFFAVLAPAYAPIAAVQGFSYLILLERQGVISSLFALRLRRESPRHRRRLDFPYVAWRAYLGVRARQRRLAYHLLPASSRAFRR